MTADVLGSDLHSCHVYLAVRAAEDTLTALLAFYPAGQRHRGAERAGRSRESKEEQREQGGAGRQES